MVGARRKASAAGPMTHSALVKLAPVVSAERLNNPTWERPGRTMYWSGALRFLPNRSEIPLVVDHNMERQVGIVHELFEMDWTDGPWIVARATVVDPPSWLMAGYTEASFARWTVHSTQVGESDRVTRAFAKEVSLLCQTEPLEPLAEVLSLRPIETKPPVTTRSAARVLRRTRIGPDDKTDELRRRMAWLGDDVPMEIVLEHMKRELQEHRRRHF